MPSQGDSGEGSEKGSAAELRTSAFSPPRFAAAHANQRVPRLGLQHRTHYAFVFGASRVVAHLGWGRTRIPHTERRRNEAVRVCRRTTVEERGRSKWRKDTFSDLS